MTWAPGAPEGAPDWLATEAGWVVPAANVPGLPTLLASVLSRTSSVFSVRDFSVRDLSTVPSVRIAMTVALRPKSRWWDGIFAMAGIDEPAQVPGGGSVTGAGSGAATPPSAPHRPADRPDADLLGLDPAEQLAALTSRHADAVYRVALSVTRDPDLAEDISQDALLKAWQALPSFRGDAPLKNWLLRITHNTAISALRRRRDVHLDPADLPDAPPATGFAAEQTVERQVEDHISFDAFETALTHLDELSRAVVVLREVEGMSYDEIAEVLDVPLPTVKTRLLRSRRVLATALEGWRP